MNNHLKLFDLIGLLGRKRRFMGERCFAPLGLNPTEARLLTLLGEQGGDATQDTLSGMLYLDRSNAGRALKSLESGGYVSRQKGAADGRTNAVQMTPKGKKTAKQIEALRLELAERFLADITDDEAATITLLLGKAIEGGSKV